MDSKPTRKNRPNPNKAQMLMNKINKNDMKRPPVEVDNGFSVYHTSGAKWKSL